MVDNCSHNAASMQLTPRKSLEGLRVLPEVVFNLLDQQGSQRWARAWNYTTSCSSWEKSMTCACTACWRIVHVCWSTYIIVHPRCNQPLVANERLSKALSKDTPNLQDKKNKHKSGSQLPKTIAACWYLPYLWNWTSMKCAHLLDFQTLERCCYCTCFCCC